MKTITMDYERYETELDEEGKAQYNMGISMVMKWLESGKSVEEFLDETIPPNSHWGRIEKAVMQRRIK